MPVSDFTLHADCCRNFPMKSVNQMYLTALADHPRARHCLADHNKRSTSPRSVAQRRQARLLRCMPSGGAPRSLAQHSQLKLGRRHARPQYRRGAVALRLLLSGQRQKACNQGRCNCR